MLRRTLFHPLYASRVPLPGAKNLFVDKHNPEKSFHVDFLFDVTQSCGPSSTGKTHIISATSWFRSIGATKASIKLHCFIKPEKAKEGIDLRLLKEAFDKGNHANRMKGLQITLENEKWIRCSIGLNGNVGQSKSGHSTMIAMTSGLVQFDETGIFLGIQCSGS